MNIELAFKGFLRLLKSTKGQMRGGKYLNRKWTGKRWDYEYMGQKKKSSKDNSTPSLFSESGIANKTNVNPIGQEKSVSLSQESRAAATSATQQSLFGKKKVEASKPSKPAFSLIQDDKTTGEKKNAANASQGGLFGKKTDSEAFTKKDFKPELKLEGNETTASLVTNVKNALLKEGLDAKARDFVDKAFKEKDLSSLKNLASQYVDVNGDLVAKPTLGASEQPNNFDTMPESNPEAVTTTRLENEPATLRPTPEQIPTTENGITHSPTLARFTNPKNGKVSQYGYGMATSNIANKLGLPKGTDYYAEGKLNKKGIFVADKYYPASNEQEAKEKAKGLVIDTTAKSPLEISSLIDKIGKQVSDSPLTEMTYGRVKDLIDRTGSTPERINKQVSEKEIVQSIFDTVTDHYVKERLAQDYPDYVKYNKREQTPPKQKTSFDTAKMHETIRGLIGGFEQKNKHKNKKKSTLSTFLKSFLPNTKINLFGLPITIEIKRGMYRTGKDANGIPWATKLDSDYGYIRRTTGADGEQIDCYIGQNPHSDLVFVMNQKFPSGRFDEHKVMLGYNSKDEAIHSYLANNPKAKTLFDSMEILTLPQFKQWLMTGSKQRRMEINVVKFKSVLAEMMLMKANGYSYIKKERRGNRWKYWYKDDVTGAVTSTDEPKDEKDGQPKQLTFMDSIKNFFKGDVNKAKEEYQKDLQAVGKGIPETSFQAQYKEYFTNKEKIDDYLKRLAEKRGQAVKSAPKNDTDKAKGTAENGQKKAMIQAAIQRMPKKIPGTNIDVNVAKKLYEKYGNGAIKDNFDTMPEGEREKPREDKSVEEYKKMMNGFSVSYLEEMKDMYSEQSKDYGYDNTKKIKAIDELIEQKTEHKPESKPVDNGKQSNTYKEVFDKVKGLSKEELETRLERVKKLPSSKGKDSIQAIQDALNNLSPKNEILKEEKVFDDDNVDKENLRYNNIIQNIIQKSPTESEKKFLAGAIDFVPNMNTQDKSYLESLAKKYNINTKAEQPKAANTPKPKLSPDERKKKVAEMSTKIKKVQEQAAEQLADKKVESESNRLEENHTQFSDSFKVKPANEIKTKEQYTTKDNYDKPVIEGIKQSILANGYDQSKPITIDSDGYVVDGHHRFTAVSELIKDGKLPKDTPIPTITKTYKNEAERLMDQVSANKMRRVVNVMDDAKAYSQLVAQGKTPQEISDRTGESIDKVKNTIALNNLIPELQHLLNSDHMSDKKRKDNSDGTKTKQESLGQGIAIAIARNGVDDDGKPNGTIQRKAFAYANQNKGATPSQVADYIKTLKSQNFNFGGGLDDKGRSREQQEALRNVGGDEGKAHANASKAESFIKDTHNALSKLFGASTGEIDPKLMKELTNSIVGARGEGKAQTLQEHIDTMVKTLVAARDMIKNELGNIKGNASMDDMFAMAKSELWRKRALFELNKRIHMARQYDYLRR